jgi:hypothetical protein
MRRALALAGGFAPEKGRTCCNSATKSGKPGVRISSSPKRSTAALESSDPAGYFGVVVEAQLTGSDDVAPSC